MYVDPYRPTVVLLKCRLGGSGAVTLMPSYNPPNPLEAVLENIIGSLLKYGDIYF